MLSGGPCSYVGDSQMIERVQRRATKYVPELYNLECDDRQTALNLPISKISCLYVNNYIQYFT